MSGFLVGATQATAALGAVSQIFGGPGGVTLGDFIFVDIEVPEKITWGGKQSTARQVAPGGNVQISNMGIIYPPISWSGIFGGVDALTRSRTLYAMLNAGAPVILSWNDRVYTVNIISYTCDDTYLVWIPYRITCDILADETLSGATVQPSLVSSVTSGLASAVGITPDTLASVSNAMTTAQSLAQTVGTITGGSASALALQGAIGTAQSATAGAQALAEGNLGGVVVSAADVGDGVFPGGSASAGTAAVATAAEAAQILATLPVAAGYLGVAATNVANASP